MMISTEYTSVLIPRPSTTLDEIKAKAEAYQRDLKHALTSLEVPDISAELASIQGKLDALKQGLSKQLGEIHFPALHEELDRLMAEAEVHQREINRAVSALGLPNLVEAYEKAQTMRDAYKGLAMESLKDISYLASTHASDYAVRRKAELTKKLAELEK